MTRLEEINARLSAIATEIDGATGEALTALETETTSLVEERNRIMAEIQQRQALRGRIAAGTEPTMTILDAPVSAPNEDEARARAFVESRRTSIGAEQTRATLISGGTLATPTSVSGINDIVGSKVSSIIDMVKVVNCVGMGSNEVAYVDEDQGAAATQTEGQAVSVTKTKWGYKTIYPESHVVLSQISKQAKKQTPLMYESKVKEQALTALRKKAASVVTAALKKSNINATVFTTVKSGKGAIDETTLRKLALGYGGDESVVGEAVLFLNKADLIAFGDVRGTNEKKAVYEIIPDSSNPNTGVIKDGGLSVKYCINSNLTACAGTAQGTADTATMFYGNPTCLELDLFSDYEIKVSEDFAFDKLLDTIRGDVELGADVVVKGGFVALTIPKTA